MSSAHNHSMRIMPAIGPSLHFRRALTEFVRGCCFQRARWLALVAVVAIAAPAHARGKQLHSDMGKAPYGIETPYTVAEVAGMTGFSPQTITRLFEREPGVLIINREHTERKRRYRSIRIPRAVYERVVRRLSV